MSAADLKSLSSIVRSLISIPDKRTAAIVAGSSSRAVSANRSAARAADDTAYKQERWPFSTVIESEVSKSQRPP